MTVATLFRACLLACSAVIASAATLASAETYDRLFNLTLTWETGAPDGFEREMYKINGQFPGPLLELNEGDNVAVYVQNDSPYNVTIHYHGIEMLNTPWSDGVPGLTQIHIQSGCAFTYKWTATQHGAFWYHSHSDSQLNDGLYGPMIIHPKAGTVTPYSLITNDSASISSIEDAEKNRVPVMIADWRHLTSGYEYEISLKSKLEHICFDSIIVNGQGNVNCLTQEQMAPLTTPGQAILLKAAPGAQLTPKGCVPPEVLAAIAPPGGPSPDISVIPQDLFYDCNATTTPPAVISVTRNQTDPYKWVMLDLIAGFGLHTAQVSLDELSLTVIAVDGNYVHPFPANSILIANGQRYTVLVQPKEAKKYTLRISSVIDPQILFGTAIFDFNIDGEDQDDTPSVPYINERGVNVTSDCKFFNGVQGVVPYPESPISQHVDATYKVTMEPDHQANLWAFNVTHRPEHLENVIPVLFRPEPGMENNHTITVPSEADWVDYIMQVPAGQPPHPVHIHGRHFYVLGMGMGPFNWSSVDEAAAVLPPGTFNLENPPLRDTFPTPPASTGPSWLVLRRPSDNPGVWLIHCHIMSHLQGGMSMVIQDGTDNLPAIPEEYSGYQCSAQSGYDD
ncbi:multicopper oxidase [Xylariales sp. PMI_506]|nr:multicopper oxidase [Xylariales sp. PMI_506]